MLAKRLTSFRKVAALAERPTPFRRLVAAAIAGSIAFGLTQLLLWLGWGAGTSALFFSSVALAVAAGVAAATMKRGIAVVYGILAALWVLLELFALLLGTVASGI